MHWSFPFIFSSLLLLGFFWSICSSPLKWRQRHESVQSSINQPSLLTGNTEHSRIKIVYVMPRIVALPSYEGLRLVCWNQAFAGSPPTDISSQTSLGSISFFCAQENIAIVGTLVWLSPVWLSETQHPFSNLLLALPPFFWFTAKINGTPGHVPLSYYFCQ